MNDLANRLANQNQIFCTNIHFSLVKILKFTLQFNATSIDRIIFVFLFIIDLLLSIE